MRVAKISGAALASILLTVSVGLTACSSSSSDSSSDAGSSGSAAAEATTGSSAPPIGDGGGVDSSTEVTAADACAQIKTASDGAMKGFQSTVSEDWNKFAEETLALSDSATDPTLQGSLMNLAVSAQFTVTGLESSEDLVTAKGDFDTVLKDMNTVCTAAGTPIS